MTEKIGIIKNPLTIIAIFAGIAEVSGTIVLPFISDANQLTFIYFLITFPIVLVILFFLTLNFNNKALYAPSDFLNEDNYVKIFKYDISKQEKVEVRISSDEILTQLNENILAIKNINAGKIHKLESEVKSLKENGNILEENEPFEEHNFTIVEISNFRTAPELKIILEKMGYPTRIYSSPGEDDDKNYSKLSEHKCIWLGQRVKFQSAIAVIRAAKVKYPTLTYIELTEYEEFIPDEIHDSIYIGGATSTAIESGLKSWTNEDFDRLFSVTSQKEFRELINEFK